MRRRLGRWNASREEFEGRVFTQKKTQKRREERITHLNATPSTPVSLNVFLTSRATISTRLPRLTGGFEVDMIEYVAENTTGLDVGCEERAERRRDWDW